MLSLGSRERRSPNPENGWNPEWTIFVEKNRLHIRVTPVTMFHTLYNSACCAGSRAGLRGCLSNRTPTFLFFFGHEIIEMKSAQENLALFRDPPTPSARNRRLRKFFRLIPHPFTRGSHKVYSTPVARTPQVLTPPPPNP